MYGTLFRIRVEYNLSGAPPVEWGATVHSVFFRLLLLPFALLAPGRGRCRGVE